MTTSTTNQPPVHNQITREIQDLLPCCMLRYMVVISRLLKQQRRSRGENDNGLKRLKERAVRSCRKHTKRRNTLPKMTYPDDLPLTARKNEILKAIRNHPVVIIAGETGSGKTTQLPKICLEAGRGVEASIACTQPRRVAALSVSKRIAEELDVKWGREVGCKIRFSDETVPETRIKMMTDGMLLAEIQSDPDLYDYDTIIIDEAHERSLSIDFLLGYLRMLRKKRPDLKIIITSATIDLETFSKAFDGAPIIEVSGRVFPVEIQYLPPEEGQRSDESTYIDASVDAVDMVVSESRKGDILVFMPTEKDIHETRRRLEGRSIHKTDILPLFGRLTASDQQRVFNPEKGKRRIVIATNIAETSLTIPRIKYVIDPGLARISRYNARNQTHRLPVESIAQSSARQRAGRCGRVSDGVCLRLYSEENLKERPEYTQPEIQRSNLAEVILRMLSLRLGDIRTFPFIDPPHPQAINGGYQLLNELGAIDDHRNLTQLGKDMARLPINPTVSRMVLQAREENALHDVLIIASAISIQDPRVRPVEKQKEADAEHRKFIHAESDFLTLLNIWNAYHDQLENMNRQSVARRFCKRHYISFNRMREWRDIYMQLRRILRELGFRWKAESGGYDAVHRSVLCGLLSNIAQKKEDNFYRAARSREVMLFPGSGLFIRKPDEKKPCLDKAKQKNTPGWVMAAEIVETSRLFARISARVHPRWVTDLGSHLCNATYSEPYWNEKTGRVMVTETLTVYGLQVQRRQVSYHRVDPVEAKDIFIREALVKEAFGAPPDFMVNNRSVRQRIETWQMTRRSDYFNLDEAMYRFYAERLPNISSISDLNRLLKKHTNKEPAFLHMRNSDLTNGQTVEIDENNFPAQLAIEGETLPLSYAYNPGQPDDGVTVTIPHRLLNAIPPEALEWLVPGMLQEKIAVLLRNLPKVKRKKFVPIPDSARDLINSLHPPHGSLLASLEAVALKQYGLRVERFEWREDTLPDHLKMRIVVEADKGGPALEGREIRKLLGTLKDRAKSAETDLWTITALKWEHYDLRGWTVGDLPERVDVSSVGVVPLYGYPGLYLDHEMVGVRLFRDPAEAERESREGLLKLYEMELREDLVWLRRDLRDVEGFISLCVRVGGKDRFEKAAYDYLTDLILIDGSVFPLAEERFRTTVVEASALIRGIAPKFLGRLGPIEETYQSLSAYSEEYPEFQADLDRLLPADFLRAIPFQRLDHLPRYLKAMQIRAERTKLDAVKDRRKAKQVAPYQMELENLENNQPSASSGAKLLIEEYRWMLEEFRVSIFAQELRTPQPISEKRLDRKLEEVRGALAIG